mgnify:CR=1 FL=1
MWTRKQSVMAGVFVATMLVVVGVVVLAPFSRTNVIYAEHDAAPESVQRALDHAQSLSEAFQYVAETVRPSVVSIHSIQKIRATSRGQSPEIPDELRRFFGDDEMLERFFDFGPPHGGGGQIRQGLGSGVIISTDGYVLTNNHVVGRADEVTVTLADGRELAAEVIGTDEKTDLAVVKVDAGGLTASPLGDSDLVKVGEWILAIGSPFNYHQTVTAGIVSAKGRSVGVADYEDFIQTDAAINPGNSGGPLVNLRGEVIGINTAIASRSGGFNGLGFSIPSNMVRSITDAIVKHGRVQRGKLGVIVQELTDELAQSFQYDSSDGVLIGDVQAGSPAERAGLQAGDIVTHLNGRLVKNVRDLRHSVAAMAPGTHVEVGISRDGRRKVLGLELVELEEKPLATHREEADSSDELGLTIETLTPELARRLRLDNDVRGVVVTRVESGSIAERAQLQRGNVIVSVGSIPVETAAEFREAVAELDLRAGVRLQVLHDGIRRFAFLRELR